jgi:hypothetical protein
VKRATEQQVVNSVENITRDARNRLGQLEVELHNHGYNHYSALVGNVRTKVERALLDFVEEIDR